MANKNIFGSSKRMRTSKISVANHAPAVTAVNEAGGVAYSRSDESALAQLVVTGTLNNTYYVSGSEQLDKIKELASKCSDTFLAKCAVYGHEVAKMKDTPALLLAILASRGKVDLLKQIFSRVITNQRMLRNFVQILRSGKVGRKSFGTAIKKLIQNWLAGQTGNSLFKGAVGNDPSLADIVKMVHPHPESEEKQAFYGWLLGKEYAFGVLPGSVQTFEKFKKGETDEIPDADFRMLTALQLTKEQWTAIALKMPWNALRMNLNTFARHGVYDNCEVVTKLADKLADKTNVQRNNAFPYQLLTTYQNVETNIPTRLSLALQQAMEFATENVPVLNGQTAVCIDTSGSMDSPVTGSKPGSTTKTKCVDIAGLVAASLLRKNPAQTTIVPFDTTVHTVHVNPMDSVMTNARKLALRGGGTDCGCALRWLNDNNWHGSQVIYVSDNESWYGRSHYGLYGRTTSMAAEWERCKHRNRGAKLICIDIQPNTTVQTPDNKDVLNIGGFSDSVFEVVANFVNNDSRDFVQVIQSYE